MDSSRGVRWAPPAVSSDYHTQSRQRGRERTRAETPQARPILRKSSRLGGNGGRVHTESSREPRKQFQRLEHRGDAILEWSVKQKQLHEDTNRDHLPFQISQKTILVAVATIVLVNPTFLKKMVRIPDDLRSSQILFDINLK